MGVVEMTLIFTVIIQIIFGLTPDRTMKSRRVK